MCAKPGVVRFGEVSGWLFSSLFKTWCLVLMCFDGVLMEQYSCVSKNAVWGCLSVSVRQGMFVEGRRGSILLPCPARLSFYVCVSCEHCCTPLLYSIFFLLNHNFGLSVALFVASWHRSRVVAFLVFVQPGRSSQLFVAKLRWSR